MNGIINLGAVGNFENGAAGHSLAKRLNQCRFHKGGTIKISIWVLISDELLRLPLPRSFMVVMLNDLETLGSTMEGHKQMQEEEIILLPQYWPRITHQELQQISGDVYFNRAHSSPFLFMLLCCVHLSHPERTGKDAYTMIILNISKTCIGQYHFKNFVL